MEFLLEMPMLVLSNSIKRYSLEFHKISSSQKRDRCIIIVESALSNGIPFRDAHAIIGRLVLLCIDKGCSLEELSLSDYQNLSPVFQEDIYKAISLTSCVLPAYLYYRREEALSLLLKEKPKQHKPYLFTYPLNRNRSAQLLQFTGATKNSMDSVSDRDYLIELLSALSTIMMCYWLCLLKMRKTR